jgi:hypothetical protein
MRSTQENSRVAWNQGRMIGPKPPLKPRAYLGHSDAAPARRPRP